MRKTPWAGNMHGRIDPEAREKMNARDVALIARYELGERAVDLARDYGLSRERVRQILLGSLGKQRMGRLKRAGRKIRHAKRMLYGKSTRDRTSPLRDVAGVVVAQPGSPTEAGVSAQRAAKKPTE